MKAVLYTIGLLFITLALVFTSRNISPLNLRPEGLTILIGVFFVLSLGAFVSSVLDEINREEESVLDKVDRRVKDEYLNLKTPTNEVANAYLGILERFIAFTAAWLGAYIIIAGWLAFKVATKWQNFKSIVRIPINLRPRSNTPELENIREVNMYKARRIFGGHIYARFLIGTGLNLMIGVISYFASTGIVNFFFSH